MKNRTIVRKTELFREKHDNNLMKNIEQQVEKQNYIISEKRFRIS